jgi:methylenetetrahydrofolate reductase (NADPH)
VLEQELRGLKLTGAQTVFCVTGDGRGYDVRPDVTQTFDLDGPRLVSLAASLGMTAGVPETPTAPPVNALPARLVEKQRAGASLVVLNHVPSESVVKRFMVVVPEVEQPARATTIAAPTNAAAALETVLMTMCVSFSVDTAALLAV